MDSDAYYYCNGYRIRFYTIPINSNRAYIVTDGSASCITVNHAVTAAQYPYCDSTAVAHRVIYSDEGIPIGYARFDAIR